MASSVGSALASAASSQLSASGQACSTISRSAGPTNVEVARLSSTVPSTQVKCSAGSTERADLRPLGVGSMTVPDWVSLKRSLPAISTRTRPTSVSWPTMQK